MQQNVVNNVPYLRTTNNFPHEIHQLTTEMDKAYIDIANAVNNRIIGIFSTNLPSITGESWYITKKQKQQSFRKVFNFTDANLIFLHGINFNSVTNFTRIWGTFFDGTYWQTLPYVDVLSATNQINVKISSTQVIVTKGSGSPPAITKGLIILEWITNV